MRFAFGSVLLGMRGGRCAVPEARSGPFSGCRCHTSSPEGPRSLIPSSLPGAGSVGAPATRLRPPLVSGAHGCLFSTASHPPSWAAASTWLTVSLVWLYAWRGGKGSSPTLPGWLWPPASVDAPAALFYWERHRSLLDSQRAGPELLLYAAAIFGSYLPPLPPR
ncbi:hypothetical protein NDU88_006884 [Pleurodeles waltl]|uniref:Uncharacterized protein n=1 Tax=Pleurodeles waltl TaxID=8319 RepID=A0AAV7UMD5_PLEWA|nr:hypothetical protein NDU88_006884 [Pleurodeles waltl]